MDVWSAIAELRDMVTAALNLRGDNTINVRPGPQGMSLHVPPPMRYLVRITENHNDGTYSWERVYPENYTAGDAIVTGPHGASDERGAAIAPADWGALEGDATTWVAYERQRHLFVPIGTFVWIYPHFVVDDANQQWVFDYTPVSVSNDSTWDITTTLAAAITTTTQSTASVADAGKFPSRNKFVVQIDSEQMVVGAGYGTNSWSSIIRGWNSTTPATHSNGATVTLIATSLVPDLSRIVLSMVAETYPGDDVDTAVILNQTQAISVTSGPDGNGFYDGDRIEYNPDTEALDTKEAIRAINLNDFP